MKTIKYVIAVSLAVALLAPSALAQSTADVQAQIAELLQRIQQLQAQLKVLQSQQGTAWCHTFNTNLKLSDGGQSENGQLGVRASNNIDTDVNALIQALSKEGLLDYNQVVQPGTAGSSMKATYFSETIASAVTGFQEKYKDEILTPNGLQHGTGYVGPATRKKLNQLYGCSKGTTSQGSQGKSFYLQSRASEPPKAVGITKNITYFVSVSPALFAGPSNSRYFIWTLQLSCPVGVTALMQGGGGCGDIKRVTSVNQQWVEFKNSTSQPQIVEATAQFLSERDGSPIATDKNITTIEPTPAFIEMP